MSTNIKTWQERWGIPMDTVASQTKAELFMQEEINDLRDALAAATAPQLVAGDGRAGFEAWITRDEGASLALAVDPHCQDGRFPATYWWPTVETAWRAWANKPSGATQSARQIATLHAVIGELTTERKVQAASGIKYGCHIDLAEDEKPDNCVIDSGRMNDCVYASRYGKDGRKHCGEWRPIKFAAPAAPTGSGE